MTSVAALCRPLCLLLLLVVLSARAEDDPAFVVNDEKGGLVRTGPPPKFPPAALARRLSGYVEVKGRILPAIDEMSVDSVTPDREESTPFADAVSDVLPRWRFNAPLDTDCVPIPEPVRLRIHFEWDGDRPAIRVTHAPVPPLPFRSEGLKVLHRVGPRYPFRMLQGGKDGTVYSRMEIAPDGSVADLRSRAYGATPGDGYALVDATNHALRQWRFNRAPEGSTRLRSWCQSMAFHVQ